MSHVQESILIDILVSHEILLTQFSSGNFFQLLFFFSIKNNTNNSERKFCKGLKNDQITEYLEQVGMFTIFGGSRPITQIAKEVFPQSFENNNTFHWDDFPVEAQEHLRNLLNEEAKWNWSFSFSCFFTFIIICMS